MFFRTFFLTAHLLLCIRHAVWVATWTGQIISFKTVSVLVIVIWHARCAAVAMVVSVNFIMFSVCSFVSFRGSVTFIWILHYVMMALAPVPRRTNGNYKAASPYVRLYDASSIPRIEILIHKYITLRRFRGSDIFAG